MASDNVIRGDGDVSMESAVNAEHYDALALDYDSQLTAWGYEAPEQGATLLSAHLEAFATSRLLDCGCGTGMTGQALRAQGARGTIFGADVPEQSLALAAAKNVYDETQIVDLNAQLPFDDDSFDGVLCVGVLSYVEAEPLFQQWKRVIRPGGVVVFTCREDFFAPRDYPALLQRLDESGGMTCQKVTDPMPYLPGHPEFADTIGVMYGVLRVN